MNDIQLRLVRCFAAVFPQIPQTDIPSLTEASTDQWDSVAAATLFAVIEEEFHVELEVEDMASMDSFARIFECLSARQTP